jgi:hypothetical protein
MNSIERKTLCREKHYTYLHRKASSGEVFYIGKGSRMRAWDFSRRNPKWKSIHAKHGATVEICGQWNTEQEAMEHEAFLVLCMRDMGFNLANLADGGSGPTGYRFTDEQKARLAQAKAGYKHSEETKRKIGESQKGKIIKPWTDEQRMAASLRSKGRKCKPMSDETRRKISENNGSNRPEVKAKIAASLKGRKATKESLMKRSLSTKGVPKSPEHVAKIRASRLAYFQSQRELHGKAMTISEEHKQAMRKGFNKHYGLENENHK